MRNFLLAIVALLIILTACNDDDKEPKDASLPEASFTYERGENYHFIFYNTGTGHRQVPQWDFGDGHQAEGDTVTHDFPESGTYTVTLTLSNDDGSDDTEKEVHAEQMTYVAEVSTSFGDILLYLYRATPLHRENFLELARKGFYDGTTFHRVIENFVIQGGDPNSKDGNPSTDGQGGPGYTIPAEIDPSLKHIHGAVGAARMSDDINPERESNGSQFYIVDNPSGTPHLDNAYTVFGITISGLDVVNAIARTEKDDNNRPLEDVPMEVNVVLYSVSYLESTYDFEFPE
jgi:cyclophilin family peptidyl-prolyl cis-trans isomerase